MDWEKATRIAYAVGRSRLADLRMQLFRKAVDYANIRVEWQLSDQDGKVLMDPVRTKAHDAFIEICDVMGQAMAGEGEDVAWRDDLGGDRKEIGDFACYVHLILGLVAR
jgi:hypothetical protein